MGGRTFRGGPSGAPSRELVRAFEEVLSTAPPEGPAAAAGEGGPTASSAAALLPGPAEAMPCPPVDGAGAEGSLAVEQSGNPLAVEQPAAAGGADVPAGQEVTEPQAVFQSEGISRQDVLEELGQLLERVSAQGGGHQPAGIAACAAACGHAQRTGQSGCPDIAADDARPGRPAAPVRLGTRILRGFFMLRPMLFCCFPCFCSFPAVRWRCTPACPRIRPTRCFPPCCDGGIEAEKQAAGKNGYTLLVDDDQLVRALQVLKENSLPREAFKNLGGSVCR